MGRYDEAMSNYRKVIELKPAHVEAIMNLGNVLRSMGEVDEAISCFNQALEIKPDYASTYNNLGVSFKDKGDLDYAILHYKKALELDDGFAEAHNNLGMALQEKRQFENAEISFRKAIQLNGNLAEAHFNLASVLLLTSNLQEGWEEYEWRLQTEKFDSLYHDFQYPAWDGSSLLGKTLMICAEQGVGDEIMFASCLTDVVDQAELCIVECDRRLLSLFSRSFPKAIFFERQSSYSPDLSSVQLKTALGTLPKYFRSDLSNFPDKKSYLVPDSSRVEFWQNRFKQLDAGLKVGISWQGGQRAYIGYTKSVSLEEWAELFSLQGISFISLQNDDYQGELQEVREKLGVKIYKWEDDDQVNDLEDRAAQIAALDLVISVDNTTAHLAGALGKPVWTILPYVPDWRWMMDREDSPWYPTMRLFRQPSPGDWTSVMNRVAEELKKMV
jgi:Tfp pilus assembly protein PilF